MSQQYPPPPPGFQPPPQQYAGPTQQTSYRKMGWIAGAFHITMMVITMGLWTPIYLWAKRGRKTVTHYR